MSQVTVQPQPIGFSLYCPTWTEETANNLANDLNKQLEAKRYRELHSTPGPNTKYILYLGGRTVRYASTVDEVWKLLGERPFGETYMVYKYDIETGKAGVLADDFIPF